MRNIILYTTEWCSACTSAKRLLESKGLEYEEINIETQRISRSKLMELTGRLAVPTIVIDGKVIGGFESLQELLQDISMIKYEIVVPYATENTTLMYKYYYWSNV